MQFEKQYGPLCRNLMCLISSLNLYHLVTNENNGFNTLPMVEMVSQSLVMLFLSQY